MGVSPRISSYHHCLSLPLHPTVTMFFLPRLPLILAIIFLGLFCLPHTINCQDPPCAGFKASNASCSASQLTLDETCWHEKGITCVMECEEDPSASGTYKAVFRDEECKN